LSDAAEFDASGQVRNNIDNPAFIQ